MNTYFAYARVSTTRQGEEGVSLREQRRAIERYAIAAGLTISRWFEECRTAARRGRPAFGQLLRELALNRASGVIIHRIDRSARNLRDWAELGELIDRGVEVRFAGDNLDLTSRSGRLSADIQAVVAADYIRNLREETIKGFYGRLRQGLYPMPAPVGYRNTGGGRRKSIDPVMAPLVRYAFELYASGQVTLRGLAAKMRTLGLSSRNGGACSHKSLSAMLRNPFYTGVMRIKSTGECFTGAHTSLIDRELFNRVQAVLRRRGRKRARRTFRFSRLLLCECGYHLVAERQKGVVYYRCHTSSCAVTSLREDWLESTLPSDGRGIVKITVGFDHQAGQTRILGVRLREVGGQLSPSGTRTFSPHAAAEFSRPFDKPRWGGEFSNSFLADGQTKNPRNTEVF